MKKKFLLSMTFVLFIMSTFSFAGESTNTGKVLKVGKNISNSIKHTCYIKIEGANFDGSCPTAVYQTAYFSCEDNKDTLSIALAAYMGDKDVTIKSDGCSESGISVANLTNIYIGN